MISVSSRGVSSDPRRVVTAGTGGAMSAVAEAPNV